MNDDFKYYLQGLTTLTSICGIICIVLNGLNHDKIIKNRNLDHNTALFWCSWVALIVSFCIVLSNATRVDAAPDDDAARGLPWIIFFLLVSISLSIAANYYYLQALKDKYIENSNTQIATKVYNIENSDIQIATAGLAFSCISLILFLIIVFMI